MEDRHAAADPGAVEPGEDADLIRAIGEALFGARWRGDLADYLDVNDRTIRRWLASHDAPRLGVWQDLERLLSERMALQRGLLARLRRRNGGQE
jgi:hypothetical protein